MPLEKSLVQGQNERATPPGEPRHAPRGPRHAPRGPRHAPWGGASAPGQLLPRRPCSPESLWRRCTDSAVRRARPAWLKRPGYQRRGSAARLPGPINLHKQELLSISPSPHPKSVVSLMHVQIFSRKLVFICILKISLCALSPVSSKTYICIM